MGFENGDRKWHIPVSDTQGYRQFGNAVVVPVVEAIARFMEPSIQRMLEIDQVQSQSARKRAVG